MWIGAEIEFVENVLARVEKRDRGGGHIYLITGRTGSSDLDIHTQSLFLIEVEHSHTHILAGVCLHTMPMLEFCAHAEDTTDSNRLSSSLPPTHSSRLVCREGRARLVYLSRWSLFTVQEDLIKAPTPKRE